MGVGAGVVGHTILPMLPTKRKKIKKILVRGDVRGGRPS